MLVLDVLAIGIEKVLSSWFRNVDEDANGGDLRLSETYLIGREDVVPLVEERAFSRFFYSFRG